MPFRPTGARLGPRWDLLGMEPPPEGRRPRRADMVPSQPMVPPGVDPRPARSGGLQVILESFRSVAGQRFPTWRTGVYDVEPGQEPPVHPRVWDAIVDEVNRVREWGSVERLWWRDSWPALA